jgi:hypothetical protein
MMIPACTVLSNSSKTIRFSNQFCARLALKFAARGAYVIFEKFFTNAIKCQMPKRNFSILEIMSTQQNLNI